MYLILLHLAGAVALLVFAVRMVRTCVECGYEPMLRWLLRSGRRARVRTAAVGAALALLLQGATAFGLRTPR